MDRCSRDILGPQIEQIILNILFGDLGNFDIPRISCPLLERSLVRIDRTIGQALGGFIVRKADDGFA
jgi:hypothetical protein